MLFDKGDTQMAFGRLPSVIALLAISFSGSGEATTLVIVGTPSHIVIASDSMAAKITHNGRTASTRCKIVRTRDFVYASAGFIEDVRFNAEEIAELSKHRKGNIGEHARWYANDAERPFLQMMKRMHRSLPSLYREMTSSKRPPLVTIFAGIENGRPALALVEFTVVSDASGSPTDARTNIGVCPGRFCVDPNMDFWRVFGQNDAAIGVVAHTPGFWTGNDARKLVQIEIDAMPDRVGPPIDAVQIDSTGIHWIEPRGSCVH